MSELFWNKVAGSALATGLVLFGLNEMGHIAIHTEALEELAYPLALETEAQVASAEAEAEPVDLGALLQTASVDAGQSVFNAKCTACHNAAEGAANGVGPALWGVYGRQAASHAGYNYSRAMQEYDQPWVAANLNDYLAAPQRYIEGTAMAFIGLRKQDERVNVIAYLNSLAQEPAPLPEPQAASEAAAEDDAVQAG